MSTLPLKPVSVETVIPARERSWNEFSLKTSSFHAYLVPTTIPKKCTGAVILSTSNLELNQKNSIFGYLRRLFPMHAELRTILIIRYFI